MNAFERERTATNAKKMLSPWAKHQRARPRDARIRVSLSLRERARVRGKGPSKSQGVAPVSRLPQNNHSSLRVQHRSLELSSLKNETELTVRRSAIRTHATLCAIVLLLAWA